MRQVEMTKLMGYAYERAVLMLFKPFAPKKWLWLLLIVLLSCPSSFQGNFSGNFADFDRGEEASAPQGPGAAREEGMVLDTYTGQYVREQETAEYVDEPIVAGDPAAEFISGQPSWVLITAGICTVLILALIVLFTWLAARFKFVWFNAVVTDTTAIKEPFARYRTPGNSLFQFYLIMTVASLVLLAALAFWGYQTLVAIGAFGEGFKWSFALVLKYFGWIPVFLIVTAVLSAIVFVFIEHFVVTIMALEQVPFMAGVRKFAAVYRQNTKDCWIYILVLTGLGIVAGVVAGIAAFILALGLMLVGGAVFGFAFLLLGVLLKAKWLFAIVSVAAGIPFGIVAVLLLLCVGLPFHLFFRAFSLYFLTSLDCGYAPLPLPLPERSDT